MARPLRIEYEGALYHVISRGNRGEAIFLSDADRVRFIDLIGIVCERFNWLCHSYCLMSNHYHLLIETPEANLSKGMQHLNGVYTQFFNRSHRRVGHVFQGRFKGILVEKEEYLLEVVRYIVLNPVRSGMVTRAEDWRWSSHNTVLGTVPCEWFSVDWILSQFGRSISTARLQYYDFVSDGSLDSSGFESMETSHILGSEEFVATVLERTASTSAEIPRAQRRPPARALVDYESNCDCRNDAIRRAFCTGEYTMKVLADHFNIHYTTVSRIVNHKS